MLLGDFEIICCSQLSIANDGYVVVSGGLVDGILVHGALHVVRDLRNLIRSQVVPQFEGPDNVSNRNLGFHKTGVENHYLFMIGMSGKRIAPTWIETDQPRIMSRCL